jgi:hypothetical protein
MHIERNELGEAGAQSGEINAIAGACTLYV